MTTTFQQSIAFADLLNPRELDAGDASDGWYTPTHIVTAAREVLGAIDTDPATCAAAQAVVQAARWYTEVEDGLLQPWYGRLWLNPPYSAPSKWTDKALSHYATGEVTSALILTNSYTETGWWQRMAGVGAMLFFAGRMQFWHPSKESGNNRTGQTLCYLGADRACFAAVFSRYGVIR